MFALSDVLHCVKELIRGNESLGIVSEIKLVTGDVTTKMTENFMEGDNPLRDYHMVKESQGQEIIRKNVELLKTIASALRKVVKDEDDDNA